MKAQAPAPRSHRTSQLRFARQAPSLARTSASCTKARDPPRPPQRSRQRDAPDPATVGRERLPGAVRDLSISPRARHGSRHRRPAARQRAQCAGRLRHPDVTRQPLRVRRPRRPHPEPKRQPVGRRAPGVGRTGREQLCVQPADCKRAPSPTPARLGGRPRPRPDSRPRRPSRTGAASLTLLGECQPPSRPAASRRCLRAPLPEMIAATASRKWRKQ